MFGRKKVYMVSMIGHFIFYGAIIASRNLLLTTILMFLLGIFSVGRASIGYLYMLELSPYQYQATIGTTLQCFNTVVTILSVIYFYYISKNWLWFQIFGCGLNFVVVIAVYFLLPESPKYLLA